MKKGFTLAFILFALWSVSGQTIVRGEVTDANNGEPLIGATVILEGTIVATTTDVNGWYLLIVPAGTGSKFSLSARYTGFLAISVRVSGTSPVTQNIRMTAEDYKFKEVVVTGVFDARTSRHAMRD